MVSPLPLQITAAGVAPPGGHYAHAVRHGGLLYVSGQLPVEPDGSHRPEASLEAQARRALRTLLAVLEAGGSGPERLLKVTVYLVGIENWPAFNRIYGEELGTARPARSIVPVPALHHGYLVEIDAIAATVEGQ